MQGARFGAFLRHIPATHRVGDFAHAAARVVNAVFKRTYEDAQAWGRSAAKELPPRSVGELIFFFFGGFHRHRPCRRSVAGEITLEARRLPSAERVTTQRVGPRRTRIASQHRVSVTRVRIHLICVRETLKTLQNPCFMNFDVVLVDM